MSGRTHDVGEWASFLSLGVGVHAAFSAVYFALVDAHREDFDPRPWLAHVVESGRVDAVLVAVTSARHDARELAAGIALDARLSLRHAAVTAAALLALLLPATETTT